MTRFSLLIVVAVVLCVPATASAAPFTGSTPPIRDLHLSTQSTIAADDGDASVIVSTPDDQGHVALSKLNIATATSAPLATPEPSCQAAGGSRGIGLTCFGTYGPGVDPHYYVAPFGSTDRRPLAVPVRAIGDFDSADITDVGTKWVTLDVRGYHFETTDYVSRTDGHLETSLGYVVPANSPAGTTYPTDPGAADPHNGPSLDRAGLWRPLCSAIQRYPVSNDDPYNNVDALAVTPYAKPWGVVRVEQANTGLDAGDAPPSSFILRRCGGENAVTLCRQECGTVQLTSNWVVWTDAGGAHARNLRTGRTRTVRVPGASVNLRIVGKRIVATTTRYGPGGQPIFAVGVVSL